MRTRSSLEHNSDKTKSSTFSTTTEANPSHSGSVFPMADDRPWPINFKHPHRGNDEEPHAHIRHFESITNNQRYPDVPNTTIKLLLFPFSLDGVAKTWLDKEPPNSILTWDDLVSKFINFFFPPSKTTNLRNEITNFRQIAQESFSEAWERFKELLRKCPHHGFSLMHQLDTFYNSLSYNDQDSLNSAAGGNFLYKSPTEGLQQMAAALEDKMTLTFRNEMNEMKNMMKALVPTPAPIKAVEERCTTCGSNHSFNVCPMTRGGYECWDIQDKRSKYC
ncbi:reverse transcriptase domain-containing protein [Tanacetum coccineum]